MKPSPRELVVVAKPGTHLRVTSEGIISGENEPAIQELREILLDQDARLRPLYGISEDFLEGRMAEKSEMFSVPALMPSLYYQAVATDEKLELLAEALRTNEIIDSAYIKPGAEPAAPGYSTLMQPAFGINTASARSACDFTNDQTYLMPGEFGINVVAARKLKGGDGAGTNIIDIEGAWHSQHSDLIDKKIEVVGGVEIPDQDWKDHGTAVLGVLCAADNNFGITGVCPKAHVDAASIFGFPAFDEPPTWGTSAAILLAANKLGAGDIMVIELHFPGPEAGFESGDSGYIPAEWWPDCHAAILYATALNKVVVIAAAGNGAVNLDADIYEREPPFPFGPFPTGWKNPLNRESINSGSTLVGAGAPPCGMHYSNWGPGRSRLAFSNYGSMVDAQAWGKEVTTTGYEPSCGREEDFFYTTLFSGTSSATAIVAGAVACLQGIRKAAGKAPLSSTQVRTVLQLSGWPQVDFPGTPEIPPRPKEQRIGNLPDLGQMIEKMNQLWP